MREINTYKEFKNANWKGDSIPKWILKTGPMSVENLPETVINTYNNILKDNEGYELFYFSDSDCIAYIIDNYGEDYLNTYNSIIPGAYKADFWRYLILYKHGGCYCDFSQEILVPLDDIIKDVDAVFVEEMSWFLYNGFICVKPNNPVLEIAISKCKHNIDNKIYGSNSLDITGPHVLGKAFTELYKKQTINVGVNDGVKILRNDPFDDYIFNEKDEKVIRRKIKEHSGLVHGGGPHYLQSWFDKNVFEK
jgi:mannosyltransferase OCH1-like enzyme